MKHKLIIIILLIFTISACGDFNRKRSSKSDEFLIEKKNPLVLPPDYSELPEPREFKKDDINEDKNLDLSGVLSGATGDKSQNTTNEIERSISDILKKK